MQQVRRFPGSRNRNDPPGPSYRRVTCFKTLTTGLQSLGTTVPDGLAKVADDVFLGSHPLDEYPVVDVLHFLFLRLENDEPGSSLDPGCSRTLSRCRPAEERLVFMIKAFSANPTPLTLSVRSNPYSLAASLEIGYVQDRLVVGRPALLLAGGGQLPDLYFHPPEVSDKVGGPDVNRALSVG